MKAIRAVLLLTLLAAPALARDRELKHDDGKKDDQMSAAGGAYVVQFMRPSDPFVVTRVRIHGSEYGGGFDPFLAVARITLLDADYHPLATAFEPYTSWDRGKADWVDVEVAPVAVPERFFVAVEYFAGPTKGIYQSIDSSAKEGSFGGTRDRLGAARSEGGWMIRVVGTDKLPKVERPDPEKTEVLAQGEGESIGQQSVPGVGEAVRFGRGSYSFLTGVSICGSRYGMPRVPDGTFFHVFVCDRKLGVIARSVHPYDLFERGDLKWVDVPIPPVEVPREFYVVVCFDATKTKGVYVGKWKERGGHSLLAYPGREGERLPAGEGWMIRATVAKSAGKSEIAPAEEPAAAAGLDASELAEVRAALDRDELEEAVDRANERIAKIAERDPEAAAELGRFDGSEHYLLRRVGMPDAAAESLLRLMEEGHRVLTEEFGFARVSAVEGKKIHLHVTIGKGLDTNLFTSPGSPEYSLIVLRGEERALRAPTHGGPFVVYGFLHELGHVLLGWTDSEHQWAHYVGSVLTEEVAKKLGRKTWWDPYDVAASEGMARFLRKIDGAEPGRGEAAKVARLYYEVGERFGMKTWGPAIAWIQEHREGEPFHAVRLYGLDDLRDALVAVTGKKEEVMELFPE